MNRLVLSSASVVLSALMTGCLGSVVVDDRGRGANGGLSLGPDSGEQTDSAGADGSNNEAANAIAIRYGDIPESTEPGTASGSSSSGGDTTDPDQLLIVLANRATTCASPYGYDDSCLTTKRLYIPLPVDLQRAGRVDLAQVNAYYSELDGAPDPETCWAGGGGGSVEGTLDIESIDESGVRGQLTIISPTFDSSYINDIAPYGALWAARCAGE